MKQSQTIPKEGILSQHIHRELNFRVRLRLINLFQGKTNIICEVERTAFKLQEKSIDL
jgi:uncharacterized protein YlaN (UPF0358 family)